MWSISFGGPQACWQNLICEFWSCDPRKKKSLFFFFSTLLFRTVPKWAVVSQGVTVLHGNLAIDCYKIYTQLQHPLTAICFNYFYQPSVLYPIRYTLRENTLIHRHCFATGVIKPQNFQICLAGSIKQRRDYESWEKAVVNQNFIFLLGTFHLLKIELAVPLD